MVMPSLLRLILKERCNSNRCVGRRGKGGAGRGSLIEGRGVSGKRSGGAFAGIPVGPVWRGVHFTQRLGLLSRSYRTPRPLISKFGDARTRRW